jgi:hypothetical protein
MAIKAYDRDKRAERVPEVPAPSSSSASDGLERGRAMARRYLPDAVKFLAAVGFSPDCEAALHTRVMAVKEIVSMAGAIPQAVPSAPLLPTDALAGDGHGSDA